MSNFGNYNVTDLHTPSKQPYDTRPVTYTPLSSVKSQDKYPINYQKFDHNTIIDHYTPPNQTGPTLLGNRIEQTNQDNLIDQSRRFSFFSKSSMVTSASFYLKGRLSKKIQSAPQVNIKQIIQKCTYWDENLPQNVDSLLASGYEVVHNKKRERDQLVQYQSALDEDILEEKTCIGPILQTVRKFEAVLEEECQKYAVYQKENANLENDVQHVGAMIEMKNNQIKKDYDELVNIIKNLQYRIDQNQTIIAFQKIDHTQKRDQYQNNIASKARQLQKVHRIQEEKQSELNKQKGKINQRKIQIENQSQMYLGILKH